MTFLFSMPALTPLPTGIVDMLSVIIVSEMNAVLIAGSSSYENQGAEEAM